MSSLRGRIWPDGTWGVGFERKLKPAPLRYGPLSRSGSEFVLKAIAVHGVSAALAFVRGPDEWYDPLTFSLQLVPDSEVVGVDPITLSESSNSDGRARRGFQGITSLGRRMVRSGGKLMEESAGRGCLTFATLTVPYRSDESWKGLMENWGTIVKLVLRYLRGKLLSSGLRDDIVYCTELQESRLERSGEPGYHLHLVWRNTKPGSWSVDVTDLRERWGAILKNYASSSEDLMGVLPRVETAVVRATVAGYLSKYLSKGGSVGALRALESRGIMPPSSWWGMTSALRRMVKSKILVLRDDSARFLMDCIQRGLWRGRVREFTKEYDGVDVTLGYYGWLGEWCEEHFLSQIIYEEKHSEWEWIDDTLVNVSMNAVGVPCI